MLVIPWLYMTVPCQLFYARKNYKLNPLKIKIMATYNNFTVTGIVAVDANVVKNNNGSAWARFPISIRTTRKDKDGNQKQTSVLQNIEVATKADSPKLELLKKGTLIKVEGFFEASQYVGKDEKEHQVLLWKATAIEKIEKKDTQEA